MRRSVSGAVLDGIEIDMKKGGSGARSSRLIVPARFAYEGMG